MRLGLQAIARIFDWSDNDIQINELLNYFKSIIENNAMTNNRRFLSNTSTASAIMRPFCHPYSRSPTPYKILHTLYHR